MNGFINFLIVERKDLMILIWDHIELTMISVFFAIIIGVLLGIFIATVEGTNRPILGLANIMQAVPSLAALGLLVPILGIGSHPAILMVVLYSLLPILKNTYTGIKNINKQTIEAAHGIGMTQFQVLYKIQLPLALPVIMAGVRISSVTAVGLMTIAAYVGAGGLGNFVISGIQTSNNYLMLAGAIPACILALIMDIVMGKLEKAVTPISLSTDPRLLTQEHIKKLKSSQRRVLTIAMISIVTVISIFIFSLISLKDDEAIVVSSKPEVEGVIIGHMIADVLEAHTDYTIKRNLGLGSSSIIYSAILNGDIDIYPEYSGSVYSGVMKKTAPAGTPAEVTFQKVKEFYSENSLVYLDPYGFNNQYSIGILKETADKYRLKTISDLENMKENLVLGCDQEFPHRADGIPALKSIYKNLNFKKYLQFQGTLMYEALLSGDAQVITPFTTDALRMKYDIFILEDDKSALSNYHMATVVSMQALKKFPELKNALNLLVGSISESEMASLNYEVVVNKRTQREVAHTFLIKKGIIKNKL